MEFNIIATVGTTEAELRPYPGGTTAVVPTDKVRKVYSMILTNTAASANTLTVRIYKGDSIEASFDVIVPATSTMTVVSEVPLLIVPGGRALKAIASAANVLLVMTCRDE